MEQSTKLYSIDYFLRHAKSMFHLTPGQMAGFKGYMVEKGVKLVDNPKKFIKPLKWFLNN